MWLPIPPCLACLVARVLFLAASLVVLAILVVGCVRIVVDPVTITSGPLLTETAKPGTTQTPDVKPGGS